MDLAPTIEHSLLRANAPPESIEVLCREAMEHGFHGVCVAPVYVSLAEQCLRSSRVRVVSVVAFPFGASLPSVKAEEARRAVSDGASEIDVVMALGLAAGGGWNAVKAEIVTVRDAVPDVTLKVILESGYFDREELATAARVAVDAGADFVKTSTGFGPRGATIGDVKLLHELVKGRAEVKASGGIRTSETARAMLEAGATRIGTSNGVEIVSGD